MFDMILTGLAVYASIGFVIAIAVILGLWAYGVLAETEAETKMSAAEFTILMLAVWPAILWGKVAET